MFIPGALHGIEASFLAESSVRKLRSAFCKVAWSRRQPIAHVGAPCFLCCVVSFSSNA